jgi:hypothetical protein
MAPTTSGVERGGRKEVGGEEENNAGERTRASREQETMMVNLAPRQTNLRPRLTNMTPDEPHFFAARFHPH